MSAMSPRGRLAAFGAVAVMVLGATAAYVVDQARDARAQRDAAPTVASADPVAVTGGRLIAFRHTGLDSEYGEVATVPLSDPGGPRGFTGAVCDRVYATPAGASCLVTQRGVVTTYRSAQLDPQWREASNTPLAGIPSRTRISPDGSLAATTSFVSGHSYMTVGFSTVTEIHTADRSQSWENLEEFQLVIGGKKVAPTDRNVWGVTFAGGDTFYATVGTGGTTYLVRGDLAARTLTSIAKGVECPSLSPDGTRIAFKQLGNVGGQQGWTPAILELSTGERTVLAGETRNVDDQIEWLDDSTILYGLPRAGEPGVTDVWALATSEDATPRLMIEQAWSPSVLR